MNAQDNKPAESPAESIETNTSLTRETDTEKVDSRRKFIQKAAAGTILTTLPASSVWGVCTVSGALSGGSQVVDSCQIPGPGVLTGGRSPGYWKPEGNFHGGFSSYGPAQEDCLHTAIIAFETGTTVTLDTGITLNLMDGLNASGTLSYHLSAAYLNAFFKFYTLPISIGTDVLNNADELVQHLYALTFRYDAATVITAIEASYTDGTSSYSDFSC